MLIGILSLGELSASWGLDETPWNGPSAGIYAVYYRLGVDVHREGVFVDHLDHPLLIQNLSHMENAEKIAFIESAIEHLLRDCIY
jgi:hypothetical protein